MCRHADPKLNKLRLKLWSLDCHMTLKTIKTYCQGITQLWRGGNLTTPLFLWSAALACCLDSPPGVSTPVG